MELEKQQMQFILEIKEKIRSAQYEALKAVNVQLINLYWEIGKSITENRRMVGGKQLCQGCLSSYKKSFLEWLDSQFQIYGIWLEFILVIREI